MSKSSQTIEIKGAAVHNLKSVELSLPHKQLIVFTGLSGSGKSSLAFDTLFAEGQRRYVESLSSYARQFLGRLNKPKVDAISGLAPAIAIEQKVISTNPRSTVGTTTEIYDYLKLLFARIGKTYAPESGLEVVKDSVSDVVDSIKKIAVGSKILLLAPFNVSKEKDPHKIIDLLKQQGYVRLYFEETVFLIDELPKKIPHQFDLVVDRLVVQENEDFYNRLSDSIETAFFEGKGHLTLLNLDNGNKMSFSTLFERDGKTFIEPTPHLFSFNNPLGACPSCEGYGDLIGIDPELVIPNTSLSVFEGAIAPWRSESKKRYKDKLYLNAQHFDFPIHKPYYQLSETQKDILWKGNKHFTGIETFFNKLEAKNYKIQNRVLLSRYRGRTLCPDCKGRRLRPESAYVRVDGNSLPDLVNLPLYELKPKIDQLNLSDADQAVAKRLIQEIQSRLDFLLRVGLDYLTLNRKSNSLSGGESQRINLATSLGSSLVGSLYILDEPSIGLHPKDTQQLIGVLKRLRDLGNTVIVVEHDEEMMQAADHLVDIGPFAGVFGGEIVAQGSLKNILKSNSITAEYLNGNKQIELPKNRRKVQKKINLTGVRQHNLKNIDVSFPLNMLTVVTGVSGSGKSTLVKSVLYPAILREKEDFSLKPGEFSRIDGDLKSIDFVEFISQNPIGTSSRSNPATYVKVYDDIRQLFSQQKIAKMRGYKPKHFSFNVDGGRCDTCKGEGQVTIEMQFMADVKLTCENCQGQRFKKEVLEVRYSEKNIADILNLSIDEAIAFFETEGQHKIASKIKPLQDVGMGYVALGQSSSTLSGGEAQRIKLASFLQKSNSTQKILFIFDEPTTGLHFDDIKKLLKAFEALIQRGHSLIVIEHNVDLIKCADYIIDLGPEGGAKGGTLVATGTPEELSKHPNSPLAPFLKPKLSTTKHID